MKKVKRYVALIMAIFTFVGFLPLDVMVAYGASGGVVVSEIEIAKTFTSEGATGTFTVGVSGSNLKKADIRYQDTSGPEIKQFTKELPGGTDYFRQFQLEPSVSLVKIRVNNDYFAVNETDMPKISKVEPKNFDLSNSSKQMTIEIDHSDKLDVDANMYFNAKKVTDIFKNQPSKTLKNDELKLYDRGWNTARIIRKSKQGTTDVNIEYWHNKAFRLYESIAIDKNDIIIYPTKGPVNIPMTIMIKDKKENYSVFFRETDTTDYTIGVMGQDIKNPTGSDKIELKVPKALENGKTYGVYITNDLSKEAKGKEKQPEYDLTNFVTKELEIGNFYVVDGKYSPIIDKVDPTEGSSNGSEVNIYGKRFEEIKFDNLKGNKDIIKNKEILNLNSTEPSSLKLTYETSGVKYNGKVVTSMERDILVTIGKNAKFEEKNLDKHEFVSGDDKTDKIIVKASTMDAAEIVDPVKDVVMLFTTRIVADGETYTFTEIAIKEKGYTFLKASQHPEITNVIPKNVQVETIGLNNKTKTDIVLTIEGSGFNVFRYDEGNQKKTSYPVVYLGGKDAGLGEKDEGSEITIKKTPDGLVEYYSKKSTNPFVVLPESEATVSFNVYTKDGKLVTGEDGNVEGERIVLTIPKGMPIDSINNSQPVAVSNPIRDIPDKTNPPAYKDYQIEFVTTSESPEIYSIVPDKGPTEGGDEVTITGTGFNEKVEVYIDGMKIKNIKLNSDKNSTRQTITFKIPPHGEGYVIVTTMNPDGGADSKPYLYVGAINKAPKISTIRPDKGTEGDIVIIRGENFLKPDTGVKNISGIGIDRLIGTTIKLDGLDINDYNKGKELKDYRAPVKPTEKYLLIEKEPISEEEYLRLGLGYRNARVSIGNLIYEPSRNNDGSIVLNSTDNYYRFLILEDDIVAEDKDGGHYKVTVNEESIILEGEEKVIMDVSYNFDIVYVEDDKLKLSDYSSSVFLYDSKNDKYFVIGKNEKNEIVLESGKEENYTLTHNGNDVCVGSSRIEAKIDGVRIYDGSSSNVRELKFVTPYKVEQNIIVGNRVNVINSNEIEIVIPRKDLPKYYDVTVTNPDTKSDTKKQGFEYLGIPEKPIIYSIDPGEGDKKGGYGITIYGKGFDKDTQVLIDGIPATNVKVDTTTYTKLTGVVPAYRGSDEDFVDKRKFVRVHVITRKGQDSTNKKFAYRLSSSTPHITLLDDNQTSAGGVSVRLRVKGALLYEPFKGDKPGPTPGIDFEDIDRNKRWTNIRTRDQEETMKKPLDIPVKPYTDYLSSPVLPSIFFSSKKAKIVDFRAEGDEYIIYVILPAANGAKTADIRLINNDKGQSNTVKFTYKSSDPTIKSISPDKGRRAGGDMVDMEVDGNIKSKVILIDESGTEKSIVTNMVRFGNQGNTHTDINDLDQGGRIELGYANINLKESKMVIELSNGMVTVAQEYMDKTYKATFPLKNGPKYIDLKNLKNGTESYPGHELIKLEILEGGKLLVERGYSPKVEESYGGVVTAMIPSYHKVGEVDVHLINPDGISKPIKFKYNNPNSNPKITNLLNEDKEPDYSDDGKYKTLRLPISGGSTVVIEGEGFLENPNPKISIGIGDKIKIDPKDVTWISENKISFIMPEVKEDMMNKLHPLYLENNDEGNTSTTKTVPNIFIQFIKGETNPKLSKIEPDSGPVYGGTEVKITGSDFRKTVEGYKEDFKIYFGEYLVPKKDIISMSDSEIVLLTPKASKEGPVRVKVINPDGTPSKENLIYTYIGNPPIPLRPLVLEGIPGYEGTVALVWSKSDPNLLNKATEFEIYGREISNSNNTFIANTTDHEYLVKGLKPNTEYEFLVRAINQYGAAIDFAKVKVKTLSLQEDYKEKEKQKELDKLLKEVEEKGKETIAGNKATLVLGKESMKKPVDLSLTKYKNVKHFEIKVPLGLARQDFILNIKDNMMNLNINPRDLYTYKVSTLDKGNKDAYMVIQIGKERLTNIPRNKRVAGEEYGFIFNFQTGTDKTEIDKMLRPASLSLKVDTVLYPNPKNPKIHKFNPGKGSFEPVGQGVVSIDTKGKYIILSDR